MATAGETVAAAVVVADCTADVPAAAAAGAAVRDDYAGGSCRHCSRPGLYLNGAARSLFRCAAM